MTALDLIRQHFSALSPRQKDVALLLVDGLTNTEIARRLGVTVHTVKAHRAEVMRRMEVDSFAALVARIQYLFPAETLQDGATPGPLRVIVVEDDAWYREYLTDNLTAHGFSVVGVGDGIDFQTVWAEQPADIALLDIDLGVGLDDGLTIAANLRKTSNCGIVMVTAKGEPDDRLAGLGIGADAYFSKPVNINELAIILTNLGRRLR